MKYFILSLLLFCCAFSNQSSLPESWEQSTFPEVWVKLEKDKKGYMIYEPCDGSTPAIVVKKDTLHMDWQLESQTHMIRGFKKTDKDHYVIHCYGVVMEGAVIHGVSARDYEVTVLDREKKLVRFDAIGLEEHDTISWVMTPREYAKEFRTVKQVCKSKKGAVTFEF